MLDLLRNQEKSLRAALVPSEPTPAPRPIATPRTDSPQPTARNRITTLEKP